MAIRIKCVDQHRNVSYVHNSGGQWRCTLANGIPAALSYAGVTGDQMACLFDLDDCATPADALDVMRRHGSRLTTYSIYQ